MQKKYDVVIEQGTVDRKTILRNLEKHLGIKFIALEQPMCRK